MATSNNCKGQIYTTSCASPSSSVLKKRNCQEIRDNVREAEKSMSWIQWFATKDASWRDPWVINARYRQCQHLPDQIPAEHYTQLRDRLQAYDRGELPMSGEDALELRRTVNLVQSRYDGVPSPYHTAPADYISPAEQEVYDRTGNNLTMALMPATIPGIAGTRALGGTEAQAAAGGQLSAAAFGIMGVRFMQKHGLLKQTPQPQTAPRETQHGAPLEPKGQSIAKSNIGTQGTVINSLTSRDIARRMLAKAKAAEPKVTQDISDAAKKSGGKQEGLEYRLKSEDSLTRKIDSEGAAGVNDNLRYTVTYEPNKLGQGANSVMADLEAKGYERVAVKNTFDQGRGYMGINTTFRSPDGQLLELQFHTPQSFDIKQNINHSLYEQWRLPSTPPAVRDELMQQMINNSRQIQIPPNIGRDVPRYP
jgi:hypothetical protein